MTKLYFFRGTEYIRWTVGSGMDSGYPRNIASTWGDTDNKGTSWMDGGIDAAVAWGNGKAYFFRGEDYVRWTIGHGVDSGYPKPISSNWDPWMITGGGGTYVYGRGGIDAAINWGNGVTYFFSGTEYIAWGIGGYGLGIQLGGTPNTYAGFPRSIATDWDPFMAGGIDAAVNGGNGKAYFFKGNQYMRYTIRDNGPLGSSSLADPGIIPGDPDPGYPKSLSNWNSWMASGIDAAVNWDHIGYQFMYEGLSASDRRRIATAQKRAVLSIHDSNYLTSAEKRDLYAFYRYRILHKLNNSMSEDFGAVRLVQYLNIPIQSIELKMINLPDTAAGNQLLAETLLHEMCHIAVYQHPQQQTGAPGTDGPYWGATPNRAMCSIAGQQLDAPCDDSLRV